MFKLRRFLKDYKLQLTIGPVFKLLEAVFELIVPLVMANIIDVGIANKDINYVIKNGFIMVLLGAIGLCSALICQYSASIASQGFGTKLRSALFKHINTLSHKELDKIGTPSLITRLTSDINAMQVAVAMLIRLVIRAPFLVIGAMVMAMTVNLKLSLIFFAAAPIIAAILYIIMKKSVPYFKKIQSKLDNISLISRENLEGNRVVRAFSKQEAEQQRITAATDELAQVSVRAGKLSALLNPLTYAVTNLAIAAIVWFGAGSVNTGEISTGSIIALVNYMTQITLAMVVVSNLVVIFTKASASASRINEVFEIKTSIEGLSTYVDNDVDNQNNYAVEFDDVNFGYHNKRVLNDISFKLKKGDTLGIIGSTGCGKSTVINLIPRFYDASNGEIKVNGKNVKSYSLEKLRKIVAMVPQKASLLSGTVRENLQLSDKNIKDAALWQALDIACAKEFVEQKSGGLDCAVTQGGKNFSGGQRQRLTIARAVAANPEILIFDDSFSALDNKTQADIKAGLRKYLPDKTIIIVSQRASAIMNAEKILVLDNGKIIGEGTHNELLCSCDEYLQICKSQDCVQVLQ